MSILFNEIYTKAIALFDDPKITVAYETNKVQFYKIMYSYLQNAIALFTNPASVGMKLMDYSRPSGLMQVFEGNGKDKEFILDDEFIIKENSFYSFVEGEILVEGQLDKENRKVIFPDILQEGQQYAFEQYYVGEFNSDFKYLNKYTSAGDTLVVEEIKDILARLLVKAWAEEERNLLLDIRNLMQDSDFKITGNDRVLKSKNLWVAQLNAEILELQNRLAWNIRFMSGSTMIGRG